MNEYHQLCPHCGGLAWKFKQRPWAGMPLHHTTIIHAKNPQAGQLIKCQRCDKQIGFEFLTAKWIVSGVSAMELYVEVKKKP